jgi:HSP20 family protein
MFNLIPWKRKSKENEGGPLALAGPHPLARFREEVDALFDRFWQQWPDLGEAWKGWPALSEGLSTWGWAFDVDDREDEIVVRAEAPGFEPKDFHVRVSAGHLVLQAEHKEESKKGNGHHYRYGTFHRIFRLPSGIEVDKIEAEYRNGVLEVKVPKGEQAKAKRITVKTG